MTGPLISQPPGATPLTPDDLEGLRPSWIATRADLDQAESDNVLAAITWTRRRRWMLDDFLSASDLGALHRRMFGDVWSWAGTWRRHDTNIGVDWFNVQPAVHALCLDVRAQAAAVGGDADEIAARFHHRLVSIHPFPNGNGRHARLAADILIGLLGEDRFSWGRASVVEPDAARATYLSALREADVSGDCGPLLAFARS